MGKNTSVSLGDHFENFVEREISQGRYKNASEVVRAGLRLLEDNENQAFALRKAIQEGMDSGVATNFNPDKHLEFLKATRK